MAGKPLHELRKVAEQARVKTVLAEKVEVAETPVEKPAKEPGEARSLNDILSNAKMRAARGEENEDILAMVKSIKGMLRGESI